MAERTQQQVRSDVLFFVQKCLFAEAIQLTYQELRVADLVDALVRIDAEVLTKTLVDTLPIPVFGLLVGRTTLFHHRADHAVE